MGQARSCCPITCALDIVGDKWTLLVVRDMAFGRTKFGQFVGSPERIATNTLTDRLNRLIEHGIVEKRASSDRFSRHEYYLTDKGMALCPVLTALKEWGLEHIEGTEVCMKPL